MNATDPVAQTDEARKAAQADRPETSRPPRLSDAPLDESLSVDSLDIDELLPVAFDPSALRVAMGPDLIELLRGAEERIEAHAEASHQSDLPDDDLADVPVPDDVMALLAEPLDSDDDDGGTGAVAGSSASATGSGRSPTRDVPAPTSHGQEEDLEQILPRASSLPPQAPDAALPQGALPQGALPQGAIEPAPYPGANEPPIETVSRALTGAGRAEVTPFPEPPRSITAPGRAEITPFPEPPRSIVASRAEITPFPEPSRASRITGEHLLSPGAELPSAALPLGQPPSIERSIYTERGPVIDLSGVSPGSSERAAATDRQLPFDRPIASERGAILERQMAHDRAVPSARIAPRIAHADTPRAPPVDTPRAHADTPRTPHIDAPRAPTLRMTAVPAIDFSESSGPRSRASARTEAVPAVLGPGDAPRALGRAIASRISGALAITAGDDQRRVLLHDGDVVTSGSSVPLESLVAFLSARGDIDRDLVPRLAGKLPPFGRHAGAALVAHGYLGQDDLWPVLRAHAEWVMGRALLVESGVCEVEHDPPARYKAEPGVFGGATGAEVFVEAVRRVIPPEVALGRLGGPGARLAPGPRMALLAECALAPDDEERVRASAGATVRDVAGDGASEQSSVLYALLCLDVIDALPAVTPPERAASGAPDPLDDEAIRAKVRARLALVEEGDYFALLGVPRAATSYEIRRAYLDLRRTFEPSRLLTASTAELADDVRLVVEVIEEAYEILREAPRRERYRRAIEGGPPRRG